MSKRKELKFADGTGAVIDDLDNGVYLITEQPKIENGVIHDIDTIAFALSEFRKSTKEKILSVTGFRSSPHDNHQLIVVTEQREGGKKM